MIGIYGYASRSTAGSGIRAMLDQMRINDGYREQRYEAQGTGLRSLSLPGGGSCLVGLRHPEGDEAAAMVGEIFDAEHHWRRLSDIGNGRTGGNGAELCLRGYRSQGEAFFANLNG